MKWLKPARLKPASLEAIGFWIAVLGLLVAAWMGRGMRPF